MDKHPPKRVAIDHDDFHARYVGRAADGVQLFLTTPFVPAVAGDPGREFVALYRFDDAGTLIDDRIEDCGPREGLDEARRKALIRDMLSSLGEITPGRIRVAPFHVERFGIEFGFIPSPPDDPDDDWVVSVMPGDYMAFIAPWDSGEYDT